MYTHYTRRRKEGIFYLMTHSTHFNYTYMASDIWLRTILIVRKETCCCHIGYSFQLTARVLLYAPSHRQDNTYHCLCYTSRGAQAGMRNSSMGPPHEGSIRRPIAPWANALTTKLHLAPLHRKKTNKEIKPLYGKIHEMVLLSIKTNMVWNNCNKSLQHVNLSIKISLIVNIHIFISYICQ